MSSSVIIQSTPIVVQVNALETKVQALSDAELKAKTASFQVRLKEAKTLEEEKK